MMKPLQHFLSGKHSTHGRESTQAESGSLRWPPSFPAEWQRPCAQVPYSLQASVRWESWGRLGEGGLANVRCGAFLFSNSINLQLVLLHLTDTLQVWFSFENYYYIFEGKDLELIPVTVTLEALSSSSFTRGSRMHLLSALCWVLC